MPKARNQCRDQDVSLPLVRAAAPTPLSALDLSDRQVYLLAEQAARHGGHPADRCLTLFGFEPTADDRAVIGRRAAARADEWRPWLDLIGPAPTPVAPTAVAVSESPRFRTLPATATYAGRAWAWEPAPGAAAGRLGDLTIRLVHARGGKVEESTYAVEDGGDLPGLMGRAFTLTNLTDPAARPYEVVLGPLGRCGCDAGGFRAKSPGSLGCKHRDALAALAAAGLLPDPGPAPHTLSEATHGPQ